jgi:spermidine synthase
MAAGYNHPKVKVHVGDGFKFLDDYKNSFDVIITDSSDPEGPAESLFQKPYFQLMHNALRDGGVITTQGCTFPLSFIPHPWQDAHAGEQRAWSFSSTVLGDSNALSTS